MKSPLQTKTVKLFTTTDGREFSDKHEALAHQAVANVVAFFNGVISEENGMLIVEAIKDDPDGFREVVGPLLRRPRSKRGTSLTYSADFSDVDPERPGEQQPEAKQAKRRGRPPGSRNKTAPNGGEVSPT